MSRPTNAEQMTTPCELLIPTTSRVDGIERKTWPNKGALLFACVKSYGGTERVNNDLLVIEDTVNVTTWYRPDIRANCRIKVLSTGAVYEIINEPENWEMRFQFSVFKARRVKGDG